METLQAKKPPDIEDAHDDLCERIEVDIGVGIQTGPCYCDYRKLGNKLNAAVAALAEAEERETMRLAGISTAASGHWKMGDSVHPDYVTTALHDVADLYAKYAVAFDRVKVLEEALRGVMENIVRFTDSQKGSPAYKSKQRALVALALSAA